MQPYSKDLRQRVVDSYARGEGTKKALASRFAISLSSVERWIRQYKATGNVAPRPNPAGKARAIVKEKDRELLVQYYKEQPDMTYDEMADRFSRETGRQIARSTMGATVLRLGITRKKRRSGLRNAIPRKS